VSPSAETPGPPAAGDAPDAPVGARSSSGGPARRETETRDPASDDGREPGTATSAPGPSARDRDGPALAPGATIQLASEATLTCERVLGRGGMGVVYLVHDSRLGRLAALKLVRGPSPSRAARFRREAAVTARLDHPGVPPVYDAGVTLDGLDYLLLRYVEGRSLAEHLARLEQRRAHRRQRGQPSPPPRELLDALVKVGEALAYAHSRGIVHRDLKPENVMLGAFGEVLVMDWGLARDLRESGERDSRLLDSRSGSGPRRPATDGALLGTLGYMSPEQARREEVDARTDVFGLGAILGEVLAGGAPFEGEDATEVLARTRAGAVRLPRERDPRVAPELDAIAARAMAPERGDRYPGAAELTADLKAWLAGQPVAVYRYRPAERLARLARRNRTAFLAGLFVLVAVVAALYAGRIEQMAAVDARKRAAAAAWQDLALRPASGFDERLAQAWEALSAAERWRELEPDGPRAAEAVSQAAFALGDVARKGEQWSLARQAYQQALGLGVDDERARDAIERVEAARSAAERERRRAIEELLERVASGERVARAEDVQDVVFELVRLADGPEAVGALVERLGAVTRELASVQRAVFLEVAEPTDAERESGEGPLSGVGEALEAWRRAGVEGRPLGAASAALLARARERIEERAARSLFFVPSTHAWLDTIAIRQAASLGAGRLHLARVACEALGRLGAEGAATVLADYLWAEADPGRAAAAGRALCRLGRPDVAARAGEGRFGEAYRARVARALRRAQ